MSTTVPAPSAVRSVEEFAGTVAAELGAAASVGLAVVGDRLGLYRAMADGGPTSSTELAARTGCAERYVREWLANQAAGGWITYDAETDRFTLPPEHAAVLADEGSPAFLGGSAQVVAALFAGLDRLTDAFRTGEGIAWGAQHEDLHAGSARFFRTACHAALAPWIEALDGTAGRLRAGGSVADVGCGAGGAAVAVAEAFPTATVLGTDAHAASLENARAAAGRAGVAERVRFVEADATTPPEGRYDLVLMLDVLHDLGDPVAAVRAALSALTDGGTLMVVEPAAADRVEDNLNPVARMYYATSTAFCTPCALAQPGGWALGNQAGPARTGEVLRRAGATHVRQVAATPFQHVFEVR